MVVKPGSILQTEDGNRSYRVTEIVEDIVSLRKVGGSTVIAYRLEDLQHFFQLRS